MNNDNFSTVLIQDPRLLVSDKVKYAVIKGSAQNTQVSYKALSSSNSQIVFNVPTPSESIIIDRNIMIGATIKLNFNITDGNAKNKTKNIENNKTYIGFDRYIFLFNCFNIKWIPIIKL